MVSPMAKLTALAEVLVAHAEDAGPLVASVELGEALAALWERGRTAWPRIALGAPAFVRHLATHLPAGEAPQGFLSTVNAADLYLACACAHGDAAALAAFDQSILAQVPAFLLRMDPSPSFADEVRQVLREKLLVAAAGATPKIAEYAGAGSLQGWLRVVTIRTAVSLRRKRDEQPGEDLDESVGKVLPVGQDLEIDYIRTRYQKEFKEALQAAFASLPQEQRHVLRMHFANGLTGDAIASVLQVNRRTVVRWLASGKSAMFQETRRLLQAQLRLSAGEFDSLINLVRSRLDVSIASLLQKSQT